MVRPLVRLIMNVAPYLMVISERPFSALDTVRVKGVGNALTSQGPAMIYVE